MLLFLGTIFVSFRGVSKYWQYNWHQRVIRLPERAKKVKERIFNALVLFQDIKTNILVLVDKYENGYGMVVIVCILVFRYDKISKKKALNFRIVLRHDWNDPKK